MPNAEITTFVKEAQAPQRTMAILDGGHSKVDKEILKELDGSSHWPAPGEDVKAQVRSYAV